MIEFRPKEAEGYKRELKEPLPDQYPPETGVLQEGKEYHNPSKDEKTCKRKAFKSIPWIKYWQYLSGNTLNHLKCTFCGADIFVDVKNTDGLLYRMDNKDNLSDASDMQAIGGHLYLNSKDKTDGYMIVPMCKVCNAKPSDETLTVEENNTFVEEIGATIEEEN